MVGRIEAFLVADVFESDFKIEDFFFFFTEFDLLQIYNASGER
jgi:hypothetical protein